MAVARRGEVLSWSLYDFGSSAFNTLMVTFIFNRFFVQVISCHDAAGHLCSTAASSADYNHGTVLWARAINISAVLVALLSPVLGAVADYSGRKKFFLVFFAL